MFSSRYSNSLSIESKEREGVEVDINLDGDNFGDCFSLLIGLPPSLLFEFPFWVGWWEGYEYRVGIEE